MAKKYASRKKRKKCIGAWRAANRLIASEWCSRFLRRIYRITGNDVSESSNDFANRETKGGGNERDEDETERGIKGKIFSYSLSSRFERLLHIFHLQSVWFRLYRSLCENFINFVFFRWSISSSPSFNCFLSIMFPTEIRKINFKVKLLSHVFTERKIILQSQFNASLIENKN